MFRRMIFCCLLAATCGPSAGAEGVEVDTTTFSYALGRIGLACDSADKYSLVKASFYGKLSAEGVAGHLSAQVSVQENLDDQGATAVISDTYGRLRVMASGAGVGDIPDELMPILMPDDSGRMLYVLPASVSGQYGIKTREQAVYKLLLGPLYCPQTRILYFISLRVPFPAFDYRSLVGELNTFSCSYRHPPDEKELETLRGGKGGAKPAASSAEAAVSPKAEPAPKPKEAARPRVQQKTRAVRKPASRGRAEKSAAPSPALEEPAAVSSKTAAAE